MLKWNKFRILFEKNSINTKNIKILSVFFCTSTMAVKKIDAISSKINFKALEFLYFLTFDLEAFVNHRRGFRERSKQFLSHIKEVLP